MENKWQDVKYNIAFLTAYVFARMESHLVNVYIKKHSLKLSINIIDPLEIAANYIIQKSTAVKTSDCP